MLRARPARTLSATIIVRFRSHRSTSAPETSPTSSGVAVPIARIAPVLDGEPVTDNSSNGIAMSCACVPTNDITPPPAKSAKFLSRQRSNPDLHCFIALSDFHAPYAQLVALPDLRRAQHAWPGHPERKEAPYLVINRRFRHRGDEQTHTVPNSSSRARGTTPLPDRLSDRFLRWVPVVPLPASSSTGLVRCVILLAILGWSRPA